MEEGYIGMIMAVGHNIIPPDWLPCDGQILPVNSTYQALYNALGNTYGGVDGETFGIPDLRGYTIIGAGASAAAGRAAPAVAAATKTGVDSVSLQTNGTVTLTIGIANLPPTPVGGALDIAALDATSTLYATSSSPGATSPVPGAMLSGSGGGSGAAAMYYVNPAPSTPLPTVELSGASVRTTVGSACTFSTAPLGAGAALPVINVATTTTVPLVQPSIGLTYIICYQGIWATQS